MKERERERKVWCNEITMLLGGELLSLKKGALWVEGAKLKRTATGGVFPV